MIMIDSFLRRWFSLATITILMKIEPFEEVDLIMLPPLQPPGWPELGPTYRYYLEASYCEPVRVSVDGSLAGIGCAIRWEKTGWIGHIIVHPEPGTLTPEDPRVGEPTLLLN